MRKIKKKHIILVILVIFWLVFAVISYWTPLAGDDWGYALAARDMHPLYLAFQRYMDWSGRFFSELWGYLIAPNKWLWDWLNPTLFVGIFILILKTMKPTRNQILCTLVTFFLIISVHDYVRMETYTWIMGTTYIVPLFFMFLYVYLVKGMIFEGTDKKWHFWLCCGLNIYIPLCMENAAAALLFANIIICIYLYFNKKAYLKKFLIFLGISIIGLGILRFSPGATLRLTEHAEWNSLGIFGQLLENWNNFLTYTFINNRSLIFTLSAVLIIFVITNKKFYKYKKWHIGIFVCVFLLGLIQSSSMSLHDWTNWSIFEHLYNLDLPKVRYLLTGIYGLYIIAVLIVIYTYFEDQSRLLGMFIFMIAGTANLVMLISPIFASRSSVYTIFFLIMLVNFFLKEIEISKTIGVVFCLGLSLLIGNQMINLLSKYHLVYIAQQERMFQIRYYQTDPEYTDAYFVGMPPMSIHSSEIDDWDTYHMEMFKAYYRLNPKLNIHFRYKETYNHIYEIPDWSTTKFYDKE